MRWLILAGLSTMAIGQTLTPAEAAELAKATKNPFELARFIDKHPAGYWDVEWKSPTLSVKPARETEEFSMCATEVLSVMAPEQAIVIIGCEASPGDVYVRYTRQRDGSWRCEGTQDFEIRSYPRRHEIERSRTRVYLRVWFQGAHGSDIGQEIEVWFDLSQTGFEPVLGVTAQGWVSNFPPAGISRTFTSDSLAKDDEIIVNLHVALTGYGDNEPIELGHISPSATFVRQPAKNSLTCQSAEAELGRETKLSCAFFAKLQSMEAIPGEDLIRLYPDLFRDIAKRNDGQKKQWLREFLKTAKNTPEVRELRALLK
jgi:hypothetical protein